VYADFKKANLRKVPFISFINFNFFEGNFVTKVSLHFLNQKKFSIF
jgi:hypothetical protein